MKFCVLVPYEYEQKGFVKTGWTEVGVAFKNKTSGMTVIVKPGLSISGRFCILPATTNEVEIAGAVSEAKGFKYSHLNLDDLV